MKLCALALKMIFYILLSIILAGSVSGRLDLEPPEPDPSPSSGHCVGPSCASPVGGIQPVNDATGGTEFTCNGTETNFHPDPKDCHSYYICYKGNATHQTCPEDMAFRRDVKLCVAERFVKECGTFVCQTNGVVQDSKNCSRYYNCFYGIPYHFTCPNGTRFDPVSRQCSSTVPCITDRLIQPAEVPDNRPAPVPVTGINSFIRFQDEEKLPIALT